MNLLLGVIKSDFFLQIPSMYYERFLVEVKYYIIEIICTLNKNINLKTLCIELLLNEEDMEKWMIDMVR